MAKKNKRCKICTENKNFAFCDDEICSNHAKDLLDKVEITEMKYVINKDF